MQTYSVGPNEAFDVPTDGYQWLVYWYKEGDYEGDGEAVALRKDGTLVIKDLTHCSCYGPFEGWETGTQTMTVEEWFKPRTSIFDLDCKDEVAKKVAVLLAEAPPG